MSRIELDDEECRLIARHRERKAVVYDRDHEHLVEDPRCLCPVGMEFDGGDVVVRRDGNYAVLSREKETNQ